MKRFAAAHARLLAIVAGLALANGAYALHNVAGWIVTLGFFLTVPGFLLISLLRLPKIDAKYVWSLSFAASILFLILVGLGVNELHGLGVRGPLGTGWLFGGLDFGVLALLAANRQVWRGPLPRPRFTLPRPRGESIAVLAFALLLPVLTTFGAFRLNNGASNILTMIAYGLLPVLFVWLLLRPKLEPLYPAVLSLMGLSILLSVSLRGWHITGHDVQGEFYAFQLTLQNQHWSMATFRDPYNACMSITILPTIIAKITTISSIYVYKAVFQLLFALCLVPIYQFLRLVAGRGVALIGSLIFISFPVFLNDMPMLNRQEIAFIFFALLLLISYLPGLVRRQRNTLTLLMLLGLVLSHYSSTYVTLAVLIVARIIYAFVNRAAAKHSAAKQAKGKRTAADNTVFLLSWRLLGVALLATFLWNMQITQTGAGLSQTLANTVRSALDHSGSQSADVSYSLFSTSNQNPADLLTGYANTAGSDVAAVRYVGSPVSPPTALGRVLNNHGLPVRTLNSISKALSAKAMQALLFVGVVVMGWQARRSRDKAAKYLFSLSAAALVLLGLQTILPQLSVDYGTLRLFQQLLIITAVPIVIGTLRLVPTQKPAIISVGIGFALLSMLLTSFVGQSLGGYPPVLALNNSGDYYEEYYVHGGELAAADWLIANRSAGARVDMDQYAGLRFERYIKASQLRPEGLVDPATSDYTFQDYANVTTGAYQVDLSATHLRYVLTGNLADHKDLLYSNGQSNIWR